MPWNTSQAMSQARNRYAIAIPSAHQKTSGSIRRPDMFMPVSTWCIRRWKSNFGKRRYEYLSFFLTPGTGRGAPGTIFSHYLLYGSFQGTPNIPPIFLHPAKDAVLIV